MTLRPYSTDLCAPESQFAVRHVHPSPSDRGVLARLRFVGVALATLLCGE